VRRSVRPLVERLRSPVLGLSAAGLAGMLLLLAGHAAWQRRAKPVDSITSSDRLGIVNPAELNVILITIDTLRADRLSCYGSGRVETPHIDALARDGVLFSNAACAVPLTLPAHASILTGTYSPYHGVRENVGYVLDEGTPTLAELIKAQGWTTAGFVSSFVLDSRSGIGRGFDEYFDDFDLSQMQTPDLSSVQRTGDVTVAEAVRWLDRRPTQSPFFLWLHLYDPHDPYTPPEPYKTRYEGRPYDGEVAFIDALMGEFRTALEDRGLFDRSMVIFTADHGEGLGDHGEIFHGYFVYDTTVRVPLIIRLPAGTLGGRVVNTAVSHVDLVPTVLQALKIATPETLQGSSLLPLMLGARVESRTGVYTESSYPLLHYGWSALQAIRTDRYKLIDVPRPELYDLVNDHGEENNLVDREADLAGELRSGLLQMEKEIERTAAAAGTAPELDLGTLARLRSLGYVAGRGSVDLAEDRLRPRADPKDKIGLHQRIIAAQALLGVGKADTAERVLEEVLAEDPEILEAYQLLGESAGARGDHEQAAEHFREALKRDPDYVKALFGLAGSYRELGRLEDALAGFRRYLEVAGPNGKALYAMAEIYTERGQLEEAASVLEEAIPGEAAPAMFHNALGEVRLRQHRVDEAVTLFRRAIEEDPEAATPCFNLAVALEGQGRTEEAITLYERAIELAPQFFEAKFNLGRLYGKLGDVVHQRELFEAALESNPEFVEGHFYLAKLLMDAGGDLDRAERLTRRGLALDPGHANGPLGYYLLADLLNRAGKPRQAGEALAAARAIQLGGS